MKNKLKKNYNATHSMWSYVVEVDGVEEVRLGLFKTPSGGNKAYEEWIAKQEVELPPPPKIIIVEKEIIERDLVNKVYNIDAFDLLDSIPNGSIDMIIADPPYGDNFTYGRKNKTIANNTSEAINYDYMDAVLPKLKKNKTMYLFTNHKFVGLLKAHAEENGWTYKTTIVLVKNNIGMGVGFRNQHEMILVLEKGKAEYNLKNFSNVLKMKHVQHNDSTHPHQKNWDVIRKMILHSTDVGDVVLDSFMGSFTTAKSCYKEGRIFIGSELSTEYYSQFNKELVELMSAPELGF